MSKRVEEGNTYSCFDLAIDRMISIAKTGYGATLHAREYVNALLRIKTPYIASQNAIEVAFLGCQNLRMLPRPHLT